MIIIKKVQANMQRGRQQTMQVSSLQPAYMSNLLAANTRDLNDTLDLSAMNEFKS